MFTTPAYKEMRNKCITQDLSWAKPAKKWEAILIGECHGLHDWGPMFFV